MNCINRISESQAIMLWNNFIKTIPEIVPVSFNPALYSFFISYYGWKPYYLLFKYQGEILGVFPLVYTGRAWVSLPHFSYGGCLFNKNDINLKDTIVIDIISEINSLNIPAGFYTYDMLSLPGDSNGKISDKVYIRGLTGNAFEGSLESEKVSCIMQLPDTNKELLKMLSANLRRKIRKAAKSGISVSHGGIELLNEFYKIYTRNIQSLGSINYGKRFFKEMISLFDNGCMKLFIAYSGVKPVGAGILAGYSGFYENLFFATDKNYRKFYVADMLHWEMAKYSIIDIPEKLPVEKRRNCVYSFGRSTDGSTVHTYKKHWPVVDVPLYYKQFNFSMNKSDLRRKVWKLIPYWISGSLGPLIMKHLY